MTYRFNKPFIILYIVVSFTLCALLVLSLYLLGMNKKQAMMYALLGLFFCVMAWVRTIPIYNKRYVQLTKDAIRFHYCFVKRKSNAETLTVMYKDIQHIHFRKAPLINMYGILIEAKGYPYRISVSCCFEKRKELQDALVNHVRSANPDALITGRKMKKER